MNRSSTKARCTQIVAYEGVGSHPRVPLRFPLIHIKNRYRTDFLNKIIVFCGNPNAHPFRKFLGIPLHTYLRNSPRPGELLLDMEHYYLHMTLRTRSIPNISVCYLR